MDRDELARTIASEWRDRSISCSVVHGLKGVAIGRDLDVVVSIDEAWSAIETAVETARVHGFSDIFGRWSYWGLFQLVLADLDRRSSLPVDFLVTTDVWRARLIQLLSSEGVTRYAQGDEDRGAFRISSEGTFLKAAIRPLLCGDASRLGDEWDLPLQIPSHSADSWKRFTGILGASLEGKETGMFLTRPGLVSAALQLRWLTLHPVSAMRSITQALLGRIARKLQNGSDQILCLAAANSVDEKLIGQVEAALRGLFITLRLHDLRQRRYPSRLRLWMNRDIPVSEFCIDLWLTDNEAIGDSLKDRFDGIVRANSDRSLVEQIGEFTLSKYGWANVQADLRRELKAHGWSHA